jgi:prepilin-type N-terminal cleavage/methylation domain-containing protein
MLAHRKGVTLIETTVALAVVAISTLGALSYQYHCARQIHIAHAELAATRVSQMVAEDWKASGGGSAYSPVPMNIGFAKAAPPGTGYEITVDGMHFFVDLTSRQVDFDDFSTIALREISCTVRWRSDFNIGAPGPLDPEVVMTTYLRAGQD